MQLYHKISCSKEYENGTLNYKGLVPNESCRDCEATRNNRGTEETDCTQEVVNRIKTK